MSEWRYDENSGSFRRYDSPRKNGDDLLGWGLIVLAFAFGLWPVGLFLLIRKLQESPRQKPAAAKQTENKAVAAAKQITKSPSDTDKTARMLQIVGITVAALFGWRLFAAVGDILDGWANWEHTLSMLGLFAGGCVTFLRGREMQARRGRAARYLAIIGARDYITLEELVRISGRREARVRSDVDYILRKNMLDTGAFFDAGRGILFRSADAYQRYLQERTRTENLTPKEANEGYSGALRAIREANDRIPDPVFSEKLDRMEDLAGKIFREVETHPEKLKQASTFFDYYLPTTLKLLGTYTEFEDAGIQGENLRQAKQRIESIMDNLLENFEKQLDELYRSEALDVDADIRVMENMLERDLSSVERDFGLGGTAAVRQPADME